MTTKNLKIEKCPPQGGTMVTTNSVVDCVNEVARHCQSQGISGVTGSWHGRHFNGWDEITKAFLEPWKEGLQKVQDMLEELKSAHLPEPESMKRKHEWSELDGEVDVYRAIAGQPDFLRRTRRRSIKAPLNIAVLCNVGNTGGYTAEQIFWRGAAAIAVIDLLEEAGYQCEVWCWNHAFNCFGSSYSFGGRRGRKSRYSSYETKESHPQGGNSFFYCAKLKECGDPLDVDRLTNGLSAWFFRTIIFGMRDVVKPGCHGSGSSYHVMGAWKEKMDISEGMTQVEVPSVFSKDGAISAAKQVLEQVKTKAEVE